MLAMLRQSVYGHLAGYEDVNDANRLRVDPAMQQVVSRRASETLMIRVGQGWTLHGSGPERLFRRHQGQDWHDGAATQARIAAREVVSLESSSSFGYDCGVKSDNWDNPVVVFECGQVIVPANKSLAVWEALL